MIFLLTSLVLGFLVSLVGTPYAGKYLLDSGIYGVDQQKEDKPKIPTSGGISVVFGFLVSITTYLGFSFFFNVPGVQVSLILAALSSVCIITLIGLVDDIHINIEKLIEDETDLESEEVDLNLPEIDQGPLAKISEFFTWNIFSENETDEVHREGLRQNLKMLFVLPAVLPLIAVGAGSWTMTIPVLEYTINWGIIYPLILLPVGLLFVSNIVNMLAGTNGLAAGMSLVASTSLGIFAFMNGEMEAALIAWSLSAPLLAFLYFNFYPASILPGDSLTYLSGAAIFSSMVVGNMEKFGVFIFAPWIVEFFLKLRSGFNAHSWGILQENGSLDSQYDKTYSLTHIFMKRGLTEKQITTSLITIEAIICLTGFVIFTVII